MPKDENIQERDEMSSEPAECGIETVGFGEGNYGGSSAMIPTDPLIEGGPMCTAGRRGGKDLPPQPHCMSCGRGAF